ncbi:LysR family transcriptional regulator [Collinsella sp. TF12-2AT]|nr:LysR family transcriptional regulator [Collinsella sp. TF12-2AT]RGL41335.1 LysR family transcriptional regulator [Collinsella sp. TF06-6AC]
MVNIKQVGYFIAVFETKSFTAAAHQCNVTVQAISKSISELEQLFNVQFFERGNSGVKPTRAGRSFYAKARHAVEAYREVESFDPSGCDLTVLSASGAQVMPELSIGLCVPALDNDDKLYKGLSALIMRGARVRVKFCTVHPGIAQQELEQGDLDALLTVGTYDNTTDDCEQLGTLPTGIVVAADHPFAKRPFVTVADLGSYPAGQSAAFDNFNNSIFWQYESRGVLGETRVIDGPAQFGSFLAAEHGFFLNAILPVPGQIASGFEVVPIVGEGALTVPVCLVSLKDEKPQAYHVVENYLIRMVGCANGSAAR